MHAAHGSNDDGKGIERISENVTASLRRMSLLFDRGGKMTPEYEKQIFKAAEKTWGIESQAIACIEELSEAAAAVARWKNGKCEIDKVSQSRS